MFLAIALSRLEDFENSCSAYDKSLELGADFLSHLNYAITLFLNDEAEQSRRQFKSFERLMSAVSSQADMDQDILQQASILKQLLAVPT